MGIPQSLYRTCIKFAVTSCALIATAASVQAQTLNLSSNQFTVSVPSTTFSSTPTISSGGVVPAVTGVPTTGTLTTPTFSFTLQGTGITSTSGTYTVGIILDEQGSQRRLEVYIPGVSLSFDGSDNLTGTLTTPNVTIYGRDTSGSLTAEITAASAGSVAFSGNSISFSAADQITFIQAQGGILADITTSINNTGLTYDYTVILARTAGTNYAFEHSGGTDFPATGATEFTLVPASNAAENAVLATTGQKLTGVVTFSATASSGGGGTTTDSTSATVAQISTDATAVINAPITDSSAADYQTAAEALRDDATTLFNSIEAGDTVDVDLINSTAAALVNLISHAATIAADSSTPTTGATRSALARGVARANQALKQLLRAVRRSGTAISSTQLTAIRAQGSDLRAESRDSIRAILANRQREAGSGITSILALSDVSAIEIVESEAEEIKAVIAESQAAADAELAIAGADFDVAFSNDLRDLSQSAAEATFDLLGAQLGLSIEYTDDAAAQAILSGNLELLNRLVDTILLSGGGSAEINTTTTDTALVVAGLDAIPAGNLSANLAAFVKADALSLFADSGTVLASQALTDALSTETLTVDTDTGEVTLTVGENSFSVFVSSAGPAATILPTGTFLLPDSSILVVNDNLAIRLVAATPKLIEFAGAIDATDAYATSIETDGKLLLTNTTTGEVFTGAFSYQLLAAGTAGALSFDVPAIDPASSDYVITVEYADGTRQAVRPAIADSLFLLSLKTAGFSAAIDSATGVVSIGGFNFKPDFIKQPLSSSDISYLSENQDSIGVAYRTSDFNGDGTTDYQVLTINGKQVFYVQP